MVELAAFCGVNIPGVRIVEYVPIDWVDAEAYVKVVNSENNFQHAIPFLQGDWLRAPLFQNGRGWKEEERTDPNGPYWQLQVSGRTPQLKPIVTGTFSEMSEHQYLVRLTPKQGEVWLLGSLECPLSFRATASSGDQNDEYNLIWSAFIPHRGYGYQPIF